MTKFKVCTIVLCKTKVELPLTATSLQRPLYFVRTDSPYIDSFVNLSTTATSLQRPLYFVPTDSSYIDSFVNLSTTATSLQRPLYFVRTDSPYIDSFLNLSTTVTATEPCPQLPKYPLDNGQFFQRLMKKSPGIVTKVYP